MNDTAQPLPTDLGRIALQAELLNARQLAHCEKVLQQQRDQGRETGLGEIMVRLGYLNPDQLTSVRAEARRRQCRIHGYEIHELVGQGSFGTVYRARQIAMERDVALKILDPRLASDERRIREYVQEARAVAKLHHPHIVQGIDVGECDGLYYFAMEFLPGGTLQERLERKGPLDEKTALICLYQTAWALRHAWEQRIIHRDIKPANLMLDDDGRLKLTDLGLAQVGQQETEVETEGKRVVRGTPHYLSPEQVRAPDDLDCRSDIYSLGATFFHLLAGRPPFEAPNRREIVLRRLRESPPDLSACADVSPACAELILNMMQRDRDQRPADPEALLKQVVAAGCDPREAGDVLGAISLSPKPAPKAPRATRQKPAGQHSAHRRTRGHSHHRHSRTTASLRLSPHRQWLIFAAIAALALLVIAAFLLLS